MLTKRMTIKTRNKRHHGSWGGYESLPPRVMYGRANRHKDDESVSDILEEIVSWQMYQERKSRAAKAQR